MMNNNVPDGFHNAVREALREIDSMNNININNKNRALKITVVAAITAVLLSVSTFAYTEISGWLEKTGKYSAVVTNDSSDNIQAPENVKLEFGYLPADFTVFEAPYKYHYKDGTGLSFNIFKADAPNKREYKNVISTEKTAFGENEAEILTLNENEMNLALINFKSKGVVVECFFNKNIPYDELNRILSNLEIIETTEEEAIVYDYESIPHSEFVMPDTPLAEKIYKQGEICENGWDFETDAYYNIKVLKSEVLDNVNLINKSDIRSTDDFTAMVNEDGTLKGYNRKEIIYGDGTNTTDTFNDVCFVNRKLVAVTIEATNINNTAGSLFCSTYSLSTDTTPVTAEAFALTAENDASPGFYFVSVDANSKKQVTIYYLVDDDIDFNNLYLKVNNLYTQNKRDTYSLLQLEF